MIRPMMIIGLLTMTIGCDPAPPVADPPSINSVEQALTFCDSFTYYRDLQNCSQQDETTKMQACLYNNECTTAGCAGAVDPSCNYPDGPFIRGCTQPNQLACMCDCYHP